MQMKHTRSLKAYAYNFNFQMNITYKMDEFARKCIYLDGCKCSGCFVQVSKASRGCSGDH